METLIIKKGFLGRKLKEPLILNVRKPQCAADLKIQHYVLETFLSTQPALAQYTFCNSSTMKIAKYLLFNRTGSHASLQNYIYSIYRFCKWAHVQPDQLIKKSVDRNGVAKPEALVETRRLIDDFVACSRTENMSSSTIITRVKGVLALFRINGLILPPVRLAKYNCSCDRAPS